MSERILGWDVGGAHLKLALVEEGRIAVALQLPCALWRGLDELRHAATLALADLPPIGRHAITMTGELADLFPDRGRGVAAILDVLAEYVPASRLAIYTTAGSFVGANQARAEPSLVASANWHATARHLARALPDGMLLDIGSTTTDIVPVVAGAIAARGLTDGERLATGELLYTGIVRTPLAAMARFAPFGGRRVAIMAELFATSADAHRLAGTLPEGADLHPAADGRGKTQAECRARLARMIGMDEADAAEAAWRQLAAFFVRRQTRQIEEAVELVLSAVDLPEGAPIVGAGTGRFLAAEAARRLSRRYLSFDDTVRSAGATLAADPADVAPAVSVALLLAEG
jgi:(4-(4-[2-(gamma-L-glutamylamino)ethyl]phenoxymethyl)furan-2-yl)methanamine synthase